MKKDITADWRKHFHNDYKIGRLSYESKMVQWTHIMMLDEMFELQKRGECLTKSSAIKRYGEKKVNLLINKNHIKEESSTFSDDRCLYCDKINDNLEEISGKSVNGRKAANVRHHGNPEGKKQEFDAVKELEIKKAEQELKRIKKQEEENKNIRKVIEKYQSTSSSNNNTQQ